MTKTNAHARIRNDQTRRPATIYHDQLDSNLGRLEVAVDDAGRVVAIAFGDTHSAGDLEPLAERHNVELVADPHRCRQVVTELREYLAGERTDFTVAIAPRGTAFQQEVWMALREIPYGTTTSYGELAARIGRPKASRAVGGANGSNPIPIIVPCHRVIGSNGSLTGFGGGLDIKEKLLALERRTRPAATRATGPLFAAAREGGSAVDSTR